MSKISNAITMLNLLSNGRKYGTNELAEILEVTPRMVRVYKDDLEMAGILIKTIRGPYGGYILDNRNVKIKREIRNYDISLLEKVIENVKEENLKSELLSLKKKLQGICLETEDNYSIDSDILSTFNIIARAIKEKRKVEIDYKTSEINNKRIIHPFELYIYNGSWISLAYCELRKDFRNFELSRIKSLNLLNEKY